jgi:hypothetical protein
MFKNAEKLAKCGWDWLKVAQAYSDIFQNETEALRCFGISKKAEN